MISMKEFLLLILNLVKLWWNQ